MRYSPRKEGLSRKMGTNPLPVKHPVTILDGGIEPFYLAFRYEITPALQARYKAISRKRKSCLTKHL